MADYLRGKLEGWAAAAADRIPDDAEVFAGRSEEYVRGYLDGAREALESFAARQAALSGP